MATNMLKSANLLTKTRFTSVLTQIRGKKYMRPDHPKPDPEILEAVGQSPKKSTFEKEIFVGEFNYDRPLGKIYDKKPFKVDLEAGKRYSWCTCGRSKKQPFCDGAHKVLDGTNFVKGPQQIKFRPLRFEVEETKAYWLCNCKQSKNAPFCDGTHKRQDIQDAVRS